jgi:hypothetical protein
MLTPRASAMSTSLARLAAEYPVDSYRCTLLFGDPQLVSKPPLCPTASHSRFDQQVSNTAQTRRFERALLTRPQLFVVADLDRRSSACASAASICSCRIFVRLSAGWLGVVGSGVLELRDRHFWCRRAV